MKKMISAAAVMFLGLAALVFMAGCATMPEGFEAQEKSTLDAKARADEYNCSQIVPQEYEAADSVLKTADSQKKAKKYKESMELYKEAEQKFVRVRKSAEYKVESDSVMSEAEQNMQQIEETNREIQALEGGAQ